jgi:hypothetical protein
MNRAASGDARSFAKGQQEIDDPTKLAEGELWDAGRRGLKLGAVICALIFLTVPPIYLFNSLVPLFIGGPLIAIAALYGSFRAIGAGGEVDSAYDRMDRAMKPLGLSPTVRMVTRAPTMAGYSAKLFGPTAMAGERHGHKIDVRQGAGLSEVTVHARTPEFDADAKGGRFAAGDGRSNAAAILSVLPASDRWNGVKVHGGRDGVVDRKGDPSAWLCDLWLAERIVDQA